MSKERAAQLVDAGLWLKLSGDLDGARRLFERALKLDPTNEKARQLLAQPTGSTAGASPPFERSPPASSPSSIDDDWGRLTGVQTPAPQSLLASAAPPSFSPSQAGLPPPPAFLSSPSQSTQQFAMPREVQAAAARSAPSTPGAMLFALPDEVKTAAAEIAAPAKSSPSGTLAFAMPAEVRDAAPLVSTAPSGATMAFAMPDEVHAALGDEPPGATTKFAAMSAIPTGWSSAEDEFQALVDAELTDPEITIDGAKLAAAQAKSTTSGSAPEVPWDEPGPSNARPPEAPPSVSTTPSGTMAFAMPAEVQAAMGKVPASSPSATMAFALPPEVKGAQSTGPADGDEFEKLAAEVEEIPLEAARPSCIAPLPRPPPRDTKSQPAAPGPAPWAATADPSSEDWGSLTEDPARAPRADSFLVTTPSPAGIPPPAFESQPSQSTQQFAMPKAGTQAALEPHPAPKTISPSGVPPPPAPTSIALKGDAAPAAPPWATPPLFPLHDEAGSVALNGDAPQPSPPNATPPMFGDATADPLAAFSPDLLPPPPGPSLVPTALSEGTWHWRPGSPPPQAPPDEDRPVPRPSPSLHPAAQSAWDQRSNPGITLDAAVGGDRALELLSSDSKITRDPAKAQRDEVATLLRSARDLLDLDDHTGAMELIDKAERLAPDSPEVRQLKERSERTLLAMFESKLGNLEKIPRVLLKDDEIIWLNLDHRAGFVLAQIDGTVSFEDLFSVSGMSRLDTARILAQLVEEGVISRG